MASFRNFNPGGNTSVLGTALGTSQSISNRRLDEQKRLREEETQKLRDDMLRQNLLDAKNLAKSRITSDELAKVQLTATKAANKYQEQAYAQQDKIRKIQEVDQLFASNLINNLFNSPYTPTLKDKSFNVADLGITRYGQANMQKHFNEYVSALKAQDSSIIPNYKTFLDSYNAIGKLESRAKLDAILQYKTATKSLRTPEAFNRWLRGAGESQGFVGSDLIQSLLIAQDDPTYVDYFNQQTGFVPRYETGIESFFPGVGPDKGNIGSFITAGGVGTAAVIGGKKVLGSDFFRGKPSPFTAYNLDTEETLEVLRKQAKDLGVKITDKDGKKLLRPDLLKAIRKGPLPPNFDKASTKQLHDWIDKNAPDMKKAVLPNGKPDLKQLRKDMIKRANDLIDGKRFGGANRKIFKGAKSFGRLAAIDFAAQKAGEFIGGETGGRIGRTIALLAQSNPARKAFGTMLKNSGIKIAGKTLGVAMADSPVLGPGDLIALGVPIYEIYNLLNEFADEQGIQ